MPDGEMTVDGRPVPVRRGQTVAGAMWQAGIRSWRTTRIGAQPRGLFCGIGSCYDCLATIDGRAAQRACLAPASPGLSVTRDPTEPHAPAWPASGAPTAAIASAPVPTAAIAPARYDVAVIGAGPAGLAAAATASLAGARVVLVDSAPRPGGQFWRHREGDDAPVTRDRTVFLGLRSIVDERVDQLLGAAVWFVEPGFVLHTSDGHGQTRRVAADRLVLATGAHDRALPFPGWDLPGVVTAGAAQALLKDSGVPVGHEVVVAGAGPFLLPVAVGLAEAGVRVAAVVEAGDPRRYLRGAARLAGVPGKLGEAAAYVAALARRRIPYHTRRMVVAAHGSAETGVSAVDVVGLDRSGRCEGSATRIGCDAVAVGYGFTANLDLAMALGCATGIGADGGLTVVVGDGGETSVPGVYAAGEVTGVGGASLAVVEGELAGAAAVGALDTALPAPLSRRDLASLRRRRDRLRGFADLMHRVHALPDGWPERLDVSTLVCRCEEVSYEQIRHAVIDLGACDARTVKLLARPGMGWCQGRVCGFAVARLTADLCGRAVGMDDLAALARRPLAAPVALGELAALA